jgi:hypothetical protein
MMRGLLVLGLLAVGATALAQDEMVENPKYKYWANFKNGASATFHEVTKLPGDKDNGPTTDEKKVTYKLQSVNKNAVVVTTVVVEEEDLGTIESAPTKMTFPAKVSKKRLEDVFAEHGAKAGENKKIMVGKEEIECKSFVGKFEKGGATVEATLYFSDKVPGGIVLRTRKATIKDKVVADTTITLQSYTIPQPKKEKDKEKAKEKEKEKGKEEAKKE